ncbi:MAG: hypothetical protein JRJ02_09970 [Deltaproteobacteria bacterium]|nr:hypothetical protein [Deltaproteobacteria bacterium]
MDLIICFIDDSDFEHDLVRKEIAPSAPELDFIQAYTFDEARGLLKGRIPGLFLLDLWGQDAEVKNPHITTKEELEKRVTGFISLDDVYDGLEALPGDSSNEYLKRMFTIVGSWQKLFEDVCGRMGQNRRYGLENLQQVKRYYPGVPGAYYTRKSLISDAVAMFEAGADGLFIKPTGNDDPETRILTREYAPRLIKDLCRIVDSRIHELKGFETIYQTSWEEKGLSIDTFISSWKEFVNNKKS